MSGPLLPSVLHGGNCEAWMRWACRGSGWNSCERREKMPNTGWPGIQRWRSKKEKTLYSQTVAVGGCQHISTVVVVQARIDVVE